MKPVSVSKVSRVAVVAVANHFGRLHTVSGTANLLLTSLIFVLFLHARRCSNLQFFFFPPPCAPSSSSFPPFTVLNYRLSLNPLSAASLFYNLHHASLLSISHSVPAFSSFIHHALPISFTLPPIQKLKIIYPIIWRKPELPFPSFFDVSGSPRRNPCPSPPAPLDT